LKGEVIKKKEYWEVRDQGKLIRKRDFLMEGEGERRGRELFLYGKNTYFLWGKTN